LRQNARPSLRESKLKKERRLKESRPKREQRKRGFMLNFWLKAKREEKFQTSQTRD